MCNEDAHTINGIYISTPTESARLITTGGIQYTLNSTKLGNNTKAIFNIEASGFYSKDHNREFNASTVLI